MSEHEGRTAIDDFGGLLDWPRLNAWLATHEAPGSGPANPAPGPFPTEHIPTRREAALARYAHLLGEPEPHTPR